MKRFKINADVRVRVDLAVATNYFVTKEKDLDKKFLAEYRDALSKIAINPFYQIRYKNIRCFPLNRFKYMIHFEVDESSNSVLILAVISTQKDSTSSWL